MRTALYVFLALAVPAFAGQTVWKWVDDNGVTHYSDQPVPGATKVELSTSSNRSSSTTSAPSSPSPQISSDTAAKRGPAYSRFVVESPQQDETLVNTGGKVPVRLAATPAIASGQLISLYFDGTRVADYPTSAMSYELSDVPRGSHTVKGVVSTLQGVMIQETPTVTFHVRQESKAQPPVGSALRGTKSRTSAISNPTSQQTYAALNGE